MTDDIPDELTPAERRAFAALPREAAPPQGLEERTVAYLRSRGQLPTPITAAPGLSRRLKRPVWLAGAIAAALAVFVSGLAVGQYIGSRSVAFAISAGGSVSAAQATARVQRAGSLYLTALAALNRLPESASQAARDSAFQVALNILGRAAEEVSLIAPDDPLAAAVMRGLNQRSRQQEPTAPSRSVVWY